jgi:hypothetical protein
MENNSPEFLVEVNNSNELNVEKNNQHQYKKTLLYIVLFLFLFIISFFGAVYFSKGLYKQKTVVVNTPAPQDEKINVPIYLKEINNSMLSDWTASVLGRVTSKEQYDFQIQPVERIFPKEGGTAYKDIDNATPLTIISNSSSHYYFLNTVAGQSQEKVPAQFADVKEGEILNGSVSVHYFSNYYNLEAITFYISNE